MGCSKIIAVSSIQHEAITLYTRIFEAETVENKPS